MKINILHITDLHLKDPASTEEKLRMGYYKDYLLSLKKEILNQLEKIDFIVCTGDIIDKARITNFSHAEEIFSFLLNIFKVEKKNLFFCMGNHDVVVTSPNIPDKSSYDNFVSDLAIRNPIHSDALYSLFFVEEFDFFILSFNSVVDYDGLLQTDPSSGSIYIGPSIWNDKQIDDLFLVIDKKIDATKPLVILSHFPMQLSPRNRAALEDEGWAKKHLWKTGSTIVERLFVRREESSTLYLFGDGHLPDFWSENEYIHYTMTGQIGGNFINPTFKDRMGAIQPFHKTNEVKIISFETSLAKLNFYTAIYTPTGYTYDSQHGKWEINSSSARIPKRNVVRDNISEIDTQTIPINIPLSLIGTSLQPEIIQVIKDARLYKFDRFAISNTHSSIGWVKIYELFENKELLNRCIDKAVEWIKENLTELKVDNTIIIGIDYWGTIFASQISVRTSVINYCIGAKSQSNEGHPHENIEHYREKFLQLDQLKNIIIVTDVISTGNTILAIRNFIDALFPTNSFSYFAISVLSDKYHMTNPELNSFSQIGTFCMELPIPIIPNEQLPDESILPPRYDLR